MLGWADTRFVWSDTRRYLNEAVFALSEGIGTAEDIDTVMKLGTNVPMGPLTLADFIGLDTCLAICKVLHEGLGAQPCPRPSPARCFVAAFCWAFRLRTACVRGACGVLCGRGGQVPAGAAAAEVRGRGLARPQVRPRLLQIRSMNFSHLSSRQTRPACTRRCEPRVRSSLLPCTTAAPTAPPTRYCSSLTPSLLQSPGAWAKGGHRPPTLRRWPPFLRLTYGRRANGCRNAPLNGAPSAVARAPTRTEPHSRRRCGVS